MSVPESEDQPAFSHEEVASEPPIVLSRSVYPEDLDRINSVVQEREGATIYDLAETKPRYAYVHLAYLFKDRFIDPTKENWGIGSPEEDGQLAFDGLTRYMQEKTPPDPDVDEIEIIISVWKLNSRLRRMMGKKYTAEEALRFRVGPQNLAYS